MGTVREAARNVPAKMKPKWEMVEAVPVEVNTVFIAHVAGCGGRRVFRACVRRVSNGFAANWGFARINGWRKRSVFLRSSSGKRKTKDILSLQSGPRKN